MTGASIPTFNMLDGQQCRVQMHNTNGDGEVIAQWSRSRGARRSNINKTSYVENCETSAVGRALAMLGIGIDTSIASANEVEDAIAQAARPSLRTLTFRSLARHSMRQWKTSWTKQLHTSRARPTVIRFNHRPRPLSPSQIRCADPRQRQGPAD